jgi:formylglycine-generating enzyme required for sulfatase activity
MRADFYGDLMSCALWPVDSWERVEVPPLRAAALREAITRPAAAAGVYVDPILVERLVRDAAEEPGALPLVQETLVLLWARRARRLLTAAAYEALGTTGENRLAVALASRADGVVAALAPGRCTIARRVLVRLVQLGEGRQDTRRRQTVAALRGSGDDPVEFRATLRQLADERLVILGGGEGHEETADLPHEAMIAGWPTLRHWIDESRADELRRRRIELDARDWNANERDAAELYRGRRLADALEWAHVHASELGGTASAFLAAGRRRRLLGRLNASAVAAVAAVAVVAAVWLSIPSMEEAWLRRQANQQGEYVHLAGGTALVGTGNRPVRVRGLDVDRFEVSNGRYRLCVRAGQCRRPDEPFGQSAYDNGNNNLPVVFVNADQAAAFCSWLGRRLPTMAEWERAARGLTGRRYPWGGTPPGPSQVNAIRGDEEPPDPVPADDPRFRSGDTPEGIRHLIGNVSEWVATRARYGPNGEAVAIGDWNRRDGAASLALMGGGADEPAAPAATGSVADAVDQAGWTGFRCVRTRE